MSEDPATAQTAQPPIESDAPSPAVPLADAADRLREIPDYLEYFLTAKLNQFRLWIRKVRRAVYLSFLSLVAVATGVAAGVFLLCRGVSDAISVLVGRRWLGDLLTGFLLLIVLAVAVPFAMARAARLSKQSTFAAYERRRQRHREKHGTDVHERSQKKSNHD
jgi:hypothetical protein